MSSSSQTCIPSTQPGITEAQFSLGQYHFSQQSYADAMKYFEMAQQGGSTQAQYQLGVMYYDGLGVQEDPVSLRQCSEQVVSCMDPLCNVMVICYGLCSSCLSDS